MSTSIIQCVICKKEALRKHHSQVTCLSAKCKKTAHNRKIPGVKGNPIIKNCRCCDVIFTTKIRTKVYCSKTCSDKIRKIRTKMSATAWARRKNGTYEKYAGILREVGYTVIAPRSKK